MAWIMVSHSALLGHESFVSYGSQILRALGAQKAHGSAALGVGLRVPDASVLVK